MLKIKNIVLAIIFVQLSFCSAWPEVITLKSGKVIDGEIVEREKDYIKVKYNGLEAYYENKYIKSIGSEQLAAKDSEPSLKKGLELASVGNFNEARQEFEKVNDPKGGLSILDAVDKGSISKEYATYLFQGSLHIMNEEYDQARASLDKAWEINPKDVNVNYNLGLVYYSLGEYKESAVYFYAVLKLQPDDIEAYEFLAKAYYHTGEYKKARENLLIARVLLKKNNDQDGIARINSFLEVIPTIQ